MTNIDLVNALITAINFDRFGEIEALHNPDVVFHSFRGPTLHDNVSVSDWHREFLRDYADCNYTDLEYIEQGDTVAVRATIEAKGTDWRAFEQRIVEVFRIANGGIAERRMYGMLPDVVLDKASTAAMTNATGFKGGSAGATATAVRESYASLLAGDAEQALAHIDPKSSLIDSLYGIGNGPQNIVDLKRAIPAPAFGYWRVTNLVAGPKDALVELAIDPSRPRAADWVRLVDGKIVVIESYWMFREIGINPFVERRERHVKQVILPV